MEKFGAGEYFELSIYEHRDLLTDPVWTALDQIEPYLKKFKGYGVHPSVKIIGQVHIEEGVVIREGCTIEHGAVVKAPALIGKNCYVRAGAYIRGNVITGDDCVIGHVTELKNCILMNKVMVPHFNYVGDSILGNGSHLGAGAIISNVRLDERYIRVASSDKPVETGRKKFGAIIADRAQVGCNSVVNPGTILGQGSIVYPCCQVRGTHPAKSVIKP